ncbi:MAG: CopG family transcriptional regulator [Thermoleophilia bacterium]|nr:CopG family transcriptional regulator [Thermoleophilia bacterium]MDH4345101.1 CopG family transcriptional regulator [Thermoleophilia bacterium]MDH5334659.1 CopG family transcriptional regulator [Thermoleophilia bacterium]
MVRRQIQLTDDQDAAVRREALERGLSIAALIRSLVEEALRRETASRRVAAAAVIGAHASGGLRDVAAEHDRHFADSIGA